MLALRILLRNWRGGQLRLVLGALVLAVAVVTSVSLLADRVEKALINETSSFLAADLVIEGNARIAKKLVDRAQAIGLRTASMMTFSSVVYHADAMHLASIKAVESSYPLRGAVRHSGIAFSDDQTAIQTVRSGPPLGEAWADARLLPLLNIALGDFIEFGDIRLKVSRVLIEEPDSGGSFSLIGARILMHVDDVETAGVLLPGSRVKHRLLVAATGDTGSHEVAKYRDWAESNLTIHQKLITPDQAQARIADTIDSGRRFLLLAGSVGVVLAGIALALASHQFALGERLQVGLYKSWGLSGGGIRRLYMAYILAIGLLGSAMGVVVGAVVQELLVWLVRDWMPIDLPQAGLRPWFTGMATGFLCLLGFMLPAIWHLPDLSAMSVLRQDIPVKTMSTALRCVLGVLTSGLLLFWYSRSLIISIAMIAAFAAIAVAAMGVGLSLLWLGKLMAQYLGSIWRLALANLWRRRLQSLIQVLGFAGAIALLMIMTVIRTSLIDDLQLQFDEDTPNHFVYNVASYELAEVEALIDQRSLETSGWFSMVRARIRQINGEDIDAEQPDSHRSLQRELNLSWSSSVPDNNAITSGDWWRSAAAPNREEPAPLSIEEDLAAELGLEIGDRMMFSVGGLNFEALVANTRSVNWDDMTPNFYFLFPEGVLEDYPRTHMTSIYIPPADKLILNDLLRNYPTLQVIELDKIIERVRTIVAQVTRGLEVMTLLILACGILVMFSAVSLSMSERLQESAILRTIGSSQRLILGVQWIEFTCLGILAGLLAALGAETALLLIQHYLLELPLTGHAWLWLVGPSSGGLLVGLLGVGYSRKTVLLPPLEVLRGL